jgi:hypothetical protein
MGSLRYAAPPSEVSQPISKELQFRTNSEFKKKKQKKSADLGGQAV